MPVTKLDAPSGLSITGTTLSWNVPTQSGYTGYTIKIGGSTYSSGTNSFSLAILTTPETYTVEVMVNGNNSNIFSSTYSSISYTVYSTGGNFSYTGNVQQITLAPGTYTFETWGADGGKGGRSSNPAGYTGGTGGYSIGLITISTPTTYHIYVGGKGSNGSTTVGSVAAGGYNGGGSGTNNSDSDHGGGGGGATHIATRSGLLNSLSSYQSDIKIVAGGGGGAVYHTDAATTAHGNQSSGTGSFGLGSSEAATDGKGGGGGFTGGGPGYGGTGYVGGVTGGKTIAYGASGYVAKPVSTGDGYVRITQVSSGGPVNATLWATGGCCCDRGWNGYDGIWDMGWDGRFYNQSATYTPSSPGGISGGCGGYGYVMGLVSGQPSTVPIGTRVRVWWAEHNGGDNWDDEITDSDWYGYSDITFTHDGAHEFYDDEGNTYRIYRDRRVEIWETGECHPTIRYVEILN